jgi:hypothetical protein
MPARIGYLFDHLVGQSKVVPGGVSSDGMGRLLPQADDASGILQTFSAKSLETASRPHATGAGEPLLADLITAFLVAFAAVSAW